LQPKMTSSRHDKGMSIDASKGRPSKLSDILGEEVSYQPEVEEIIQEVQFTYMAVAEKKTRKMISEVNSTG